MKKQLITLFLLLSFTFVKSQDSQLFNDLNTYRIVNGKDPLKWSDKLNKISVKQAETICKKDSLFHSRTDSYECIAKGNSLAGTKEEKKNFTIFLKKYFKNEYKDPAETKNQNDVYKYILLYIVYLWDKDPAHREILLTDDVEIGSVCVILNEMKLKLNKITINGQTTEFKNFINYYEIKFYVVFNLK